MIAMNRLRAHCHTISRVLMSALAAVSCSLPVQAQQDERRIYQTDSQGRIQYHRPSWTVERDGRIVETNQWGEKQPHKQQYRIIDEKIVPTDTLGAPQWHKAGTLPGQPASK